MQSTQDSRGIARVNGIAINGADEDVAPDELRNRACTELLRQAAVQRGRLPAQDVSVAPPLNAEQRAAVEAMLDDEVQVPVPDPQACRRLSRLLKSRKPKSSGFLIL